MEAHIIIQIATSILQTIAIVWSLVYLAKQTRNSVNSLKEMEHDKKYESMLTARSDYLDINLSIIKDPELLKLLKLSKADMLGYIMINNLEQEFLIHDMRNPSDEDMTVTKVMCEDYFLYEFVRETWKRDKKMYHEKFIKFIDENVMKIYQENEKK